jgi:pimeloyl-ACP methyl ester carboxylesterase
MEKRIRLNNYNIQVQLIGTISSPASPVLIFLHEALGSIAQWKSFPQDVCTATGLPGIVAERRGHGQSDPLDVIRTPEYLHDYMYELRELLAELLPLKQPVILIGHSDGGTIGLLYARHFPQYVRGLVTMAAHTFVEAETLAGIDPTITAYKNGKLDGLKRIHGDKTEQLFYAWADTWKSEAFRSWDIREEIKGINCPTLILQGANDQYGTIAQVHSIELAVRNNQSFILPDCGHHPHLEKSAFVIEQIDTFIHEIKSVNT